MRYFWSILKQKKTFNLHLMMNLEIDRRLKEQQQEIYFFIKTDACHYLWK